MKFHDYAMKLPSTTGYDCGNIYYVDYRTDQIIRRADSSAPFQTISF